MLSENRRNLGPILDSSDGVHLSFYVQGSDDPILKRQKIERMIEKAESYLEPVMDYAETARLLYPLRQLTHDSKILNDVQGNLGLFRDRQLFRVLRIPIDFEDTLVVANSFHVKPLLKWLQYDSEFFIIGFEKGMANLYHGNTHSFKKLTIPFSDPLKMNGKGREDYNSIANQLEDLNQYLYQVQRNRSIPMFVFGASAFSSKVQRYLRYPRDQIVFKNEDFQKHKLEQYCSEIRKGLQRRIKVNIKRTILEYLQAEHSPIASRRLDHIAKAAARGQVETLIISEKAQIFGKLNRMNGKLKFSYKHSDHEDDCILDDLAQLVIEKGGRVVIDSDAQIPNGDAAVAILKAPLPGENFGMTFYGNRHLQSSHFASIA